jgi:hypothetical protein
MYEKRARWYLDGYPREKKSLVLSVDIFFPQELRFWLLCQETWGLLPHRCYKIECFKPGDKSPQNRGHRIEKVGFTEWINSIHTILADNEFEMLREDTEIVVHA